MFRKPLPLALIFGAVAFAVGLLVARLPFAAWLHLPLLDRVFDEPTAAATILGNVIQGLLTIVAGLTAVLVYNLQERRENLASLVEWMSNLRDKFHSDESFRALRCRLASNHDGTRLQLLGEFGSDGSLRPTLYPALVAPEAPSPPDAQHIDWAFLRDFTDYLYFFEEVLSYGELMHKRAAADLAPVLVDHFGWFLRSLYHCCEAAPAAGAAAHAPPREQCQRFFIHYLAENRYRRLTEVGLYLLHREKPPADDDAFFAAMISILVEQGPERQKRRTHAAIRRHWKEVVFAPTGTAH